MNSSSVTVRQRGVGLRCRPIGQQRSCLRRSFESAQYTSLAFGAAGKPACAHPWDLSVTPTTTPCARASSPHWNASCWDAAASHRRPRPGWRSSATSRGGTIPPAAILASATYPDCLRDADTQGNPNDLSDKPSTEPGQLQLAPLLSRSRSLLSITIITIPRFWKTFNRSRSASLLPSSPLIPCVEKMIPKRDLTESRT